MLNWQPKTKKSHSHWWKAKNGKNPMHLHFVQWPMVVLNLSQVSSFIYVENWPKSQQMLSDVKGDEKDDYKFVVQLYNPADITKGTEDIDKDGETKAQFHRLENKSVEWLVGSQKRKTPNLSGNTSNWFEITLLIPLQQWSVTRQQLLIQRKLSPVQFGR